jgi:hypothetical protein
MINTIDGVNPCSEEKVFDLMGWNDDELKRYLKKDILDEEDKKRAAGYFNREKRELLEYDPKTHCVFIKSMFKYAHLSGLVKTPKAIAGVVKKTLDLYEDKCPQFIAEFSRINHKILKDAQRKISPGSDMASYQSSKESFEKLFLLEEARRCLTASNNPALVSVEAMQKVVRSL